MKVPGFVGPTYEMDAVTFDCQKSVNLYAIISEVGTSKSVAALRSAPGYNLFATAGGGPIRGAKTAANGRAFVVSGFDFYEINTDGTTTDRGNLLTATNRVSMAENGNQLIIVDGTYGYTFTFATDTFAQIVDGDFPTADIVTFLDGYFIVNDNGTNNFYISGLLDGTTWDALDFSNAASNPDNLVSLIADTGNLWLFGSSQSTEVFQNTGAATFPFERIPGAVIQTGCAAPFTVQAFDNTIAWLGVDEQGRGVVWKANGYSAQRLSNQAIEAIIASATDFTESYAYVYHEQGHVFYCLQIKGLNTTLVYDGATGLWHERTFVDNATNTTQQHRGSCHFFFNQKNLIGDRESGKIYQQSLSFYDHDGDEMHRIRVSPHLQEEKRNITFSNFELDIETGRGLVTGQGSDPQVMMKYSNNGGRTYSAERWVSAGAIGKYKTRVRFSRCGSARDRVWHVRYSEPTFFQINEAYINVP